MRAAFCGRLRKASGQTVVEYLMTTLALVTVFASLYGFMQGQLRKLFIKAGMAILTSYR